MAAFAAGGADVLVATTVIEVGVDVPNATVMLVEGAERFGISQLHQLRGRIGRGEHASVCLLFGPKQSPRLRALRASTPTASSSRAIDLELRGEGEIAGTRQSGLAQFRSRACPRTCALVEAARVYAEALLDADPELDAPEHALLADALAASPYGEAERLRPRSRREGRRRASTAGAGSSRRRATRRARRATACARRCSACSGASVEGARVLDLFAGSGALGIEALSRGAAAAVFVDRAPAAIKAIRANLDALGIEADVRRMRGARGRCASASARGRGIRSGLPRPSLPARRRAGAGALRGAPRGARARGPRRQRERPPRAAGAGARR